MRYIIFCNGNFDDYSMIKPYCSGEFKLICCDGGVKHAKILNMKPDLIIGDFDSADKKDIDFFREQNVEIVTFPAEKNDTDSAMALDIAIEANASEIYIFGATGTRLDHTLANIGMLINAEKAGISAYIVDSHNIIEIISKEKHFTGGKGDLLSLIPISGKVLGVTTKGLYYPLENAALDFSRTRGVSNVFSEKNVCVTVKKGLIAAIRARD